MDTDLSRTPLHATHTALGARLVPFAGWEMPVQYRGISAEHQAVRTRAGLFDVCHMGQLELSGPGAAAAANRLVTGDVEALPPGKALYTLACNEAGGILDDLIVYRRAEDRVHVVCNASNRSKIAAHFQAHTRSECHFADRSDALGLIALQGPRALEILAQAHLALHVAHEVPSFHFREAEIAGVPCMVARTGYTGEDGVELSAPRERSVELWRALLDAGAPLGLEPVGLGARDTLRLEARLSLYGNEIDEHTHAFEAGLGWTVKLHKGDFIGKAALVRAQALPLARQLVGFEMVGRGIARHGYALLDEQGRQMGSCTSGGPSPTLGKNIGLGYVPAARAAIGSRLFVDCRGKPIEALVVKTPFYRRKAAS